MPVPPLSWLSPLAPLVAPEGATREGCPVDTRRAAFAVDAGVPVVLAHVLRDRQGRPVDLTALASHPGLSSTDPLSAAATVEIAAGPPPP